MDAWSLLPQFFWIGPPFPMYLGITWQSLFAGASLPALPSPPPQPFFKGTETQTSTPPTTSYNNIEEIEFPEGWDETTLMPRRIVIHRKAERRNDR